MSRSREQALEDGRALRANDRAASERREAGEPACAGDLWLLPELGDRPELWAVLEVSLPGHVRLVPADLDPRCGSGDVDVPPNAPCGALTLRARHATWTRDERLASGLLAGRLETIDLERLEQRVSALEAGEVPGSYDERLNDEDPEYQELAAELRRVCARIETSPPVGPPPGQVTPRAWLLLAAASFLFVAGFIGGWLGRGGASLPSTKSPVPLRLFSIETLRSADFPSADFPSADLPSVSMVDADILHLVVELADEESGNFTYSLFTEDVEVYKATKSASNAMELHLLIPGRGLAAGTYRLELRREPGGTDEMDDRGEALEYRFRVER